MLKPPPILKHKPAKTVDYSVESGVNLVVTYYRKHQHQFYLFVPILDEDKKPIGYRRLRSIRRHVALWERRQIEPEKALRLIVKPLTAFFKVIPLKGS